MFGPPIEPPDPCEHGEIRFCEECEYDQSYAEDMWADWAIERAKLGE